MEVREELQQAIKRALSESDISEIDPYLERPENEAHGDYSSNVALILSKRVKQSPLEIAKTIREKLLSNKDITRFIKKIELAAPGFLNFWLSQKYLISQLDRVIEEEEKFGRGKKLSGQKIMVEFTDPNPFKEFHIGHLYSNAVGESITRLFAAESATVWRANFFGDVGMHVAKAIFGMQQMMKDKGLMINNLEKKPLAERVKFMGQAYALGATAYEEDKNAKEEMGSLNLLIFVAAQEYWQEEKGWKPRVNYRKHISDINEEELVQVKKLWVAGRKWSLEYFEGIYKRLGTKFDGYYPESLTGEWGYDLVLEGLKRGIFEENDGAIVYRGDKHGLHTRVFINKLGLPTYETKDIGNASHKYSEFVYDKSLIVSGSEINEYFKVVIAAMKEVNPELGEKTVHLGHGIVRLSSGKMSSRTGEIITVEWLLDEAKRRILEAFPDMDQKTADIVSVGAVKYALLKHGIGRDIIFNFDESISLEGDSGPYLQYTYARCRSVLRKAGKSNWTNLTNWSNLEPEELTLLRAMHRFPEVLEEAAEKFAPNIVCKYLFDLAQKFNLFYQKHPILKSSGAVRDFRIALTSRSGQVLKNGLFLLGIEAPERM